MLDKKAKVFGLLIFVVSLAITMTACDMNGNGIDNDIELDIEFDETYTGMSDYFVFDYPGKWHIVLENISANDELIEVGIADKQTEDIDDMEFNHYFHVNYYNDDNEAFRENEDEFYDEIGNLIQEVEDEQDIEILIENKIDFDSRPAFELKTKLAFANDISLVLIQHIILIYENGHEQTIVYTANSDKYNENFAYIFFESFEYMND